MTGESQLRDKLRKIEALFAGAGTAGERRAAEAALQRVRARFEELARHDLRRSSSISPFLTDGRAPVLGALPYGLRAFRCHRQQRNTVMIRASRGSSTRFCCPSSPSWRGRCKPICTTDAASDPRGDL